MTIKRLDHISIVVDDLAAAVAFFTALGMTKAGEAPIEGEWVDRINGLDGIRRRELKIPTTRALQRPTARPLASPCPRCSARACTRDR